MERRKFLKLLALIPALPIACENPFKPKSKPPPIEPYNPDDPKWMIWNSDYFDLDYPTMYQPDRFNHIVVSPETFNELLTYRKA